MAPAAARGARPDPLRIFDLDTAFHRAYVESGAGLRLLAMHEREGRLLPFVVDPRTGDLDWYLHGVFG